MERQLAHRCKERGRGYRSTTDTHEISREMQRAVLQCKDWCVGAWQRLTPITQGVSRGCGVCNRALARGRGEGPESSPLLAREGAALRCASQSCDSCSRPFRL